MGDVSASQPYCAEEINCRDQSELRRQFAGCFTAIEKVSFRYANEFAIACPKREGDPNLDGVPLLVGVDVRGRLVLDVNALLNVPEGRSCREGILTLENAVVSLSLLGNEDKPVRLKVEADPKWCVDLDGAVLRIISVESSYSVTEAPSFLKSVLNDERVRTKVDLHWDEQLSGATVDVSELHPRLRQR